MSVAGANCPAGHIIQIIDAFDFERHMLSAFNRSQVAAWIMHARQFDQFAVSYAHESKFNS